MRNHLKILLFTVVGVSAIYAGLKGFIYFKTKSQLDDAVDMARPFVGIEYGGIGSSLAGSVSVDELKITPMGASSSISIDSISVRWPHVGYMLGGFNTAELPPNMGLRIAGLRLPMDAQFIQGLRVSAGQAATLPEDSPDACGLSGVFTPQDYSAFGLNEIVFDAGLRYGLNENNQAVDLHIDYLLRGVQELEMDLALSGMPHPAAVMMGAVPHLTRYEGRFNLDPTFAEHAQSYCARRREQSIPDYIASLQAEVDRLFDGTSGFSAGPGMRAALKDYLRKPAEVVVRLNPAQPLDLSTLHLYQAEDLLDLLGLEVTIAGKPVADLSFSFDPQVLAFASQQGQALGLSELMHASSNAVPEVERNQTRQRPLPVMARPELRFVDTETAELVQFLGRDVRLFTTQKEQPHSGILVSVENGQALVEQRIYSGRMTAYVNITDIQKAEVLRSVTP